jgi:TRAP-type uncharacterized transport system substrate-binding protein
MKKIIFGLLATLTIAFTTQAWSQEKFIIATGDKKAGSVYSTMFGELAATCSTGDWMEQTTTGGVQNKDMLLGNKVSGAWLQADMLEFERRLDPSKVENIKTLVAMHQEELHFIARADVKKEGGFMGVGGKEVSFKTLTDLKGRTVGAVGGSISSASVVSANSGLDFKVLPVTDSTALKQMLLEGKLDAILVVGGAPHPLVASLPASFKILSIPQDLVTKLASSKLYSSALLSYSNVNASAVQSVSTQALLVTRVYRSKAMIAKLKEMRTCFTQKLGDIQDKNGTHPKWQFVDANNHGGWSWYELN